LTTLTWTYKSLILANGIYELRHAFIQLAASLTAFLILSREDILDFYATAANATSCIPRQQKRLNNSILLYFAKPSFYPEIRHNDIFQCPIHNSLYRIVLIQHLALQRCLSSLQKYFISTKFFRHQFIVHLCPVREHYEIRASSLLTFLIFKHCDFILEDIVL